MATTTVTFSGGWKSWRVPAGITQVHVAAEGAGSAGRRGGRAAGSLRCNPGDVLWIAPGGAGKAAAGSNGGGVAFGGGGPGGDGHGSGDGGSGGGGATRVTLGSKSGATILVAGGAGGTSGDSGDGGRGGSEEGEDGSAGTSGTGKVYDAKGGTQKTPGNGGSSGGGKRYAGSDAGNGHNGRGGAGGSVGNANSHGGGGGGGGWTAGGGGQASATQDNPGGSPTHRFPAGGGGGGSNYANERLVGASSSRGTGATGNGSVVLTWSNTPYTNVPPLPPTDITVNGEDESSEMATSSMGTVTISALLDDSNIGQRLHLALQLYKDGVGKNETPDLVVVTSPIEQATNEFGQAADAIRQSIVLTGLALNTLYRGRLYTVDETGATSATLDTKTKVYTPSYSSISFWTNRPPNPPELLTPEENSQIAVGLDITFTWNFTDPDDVNTQGSYALRWRTARMPGQDAGPWAMTTGGSEQTLTVSAATFRGNTLYEWQVRTFDPQGYGGEWSRSFSFYIVADATPPQLTYPIKDAAVEVELGASGSFTWVFRDSNSDVTQVKADLRYRISGTDDWIVLYGDLTDPGAEQSWPLASVNLTAYQRYEWQVRTYASTTEVSDWSESAFFRAIPVAGSGVPDIVISTTRAKAPLGQGNNRAYVYARGGQQLLGEITNLDSLSYVRRRDDIGYARVTIQNFDDDLLSLLETIESWQCELVIFRENGSEVERVFEGPVTLIQDAYDQFEIQALDVMGYLKRRDVRQGYNDSYQVVDGVQVGLRSVVERAGRLVKDALAYDDPNLLSYLTLVTNPGDAKQSRVVPDFSKTVWEEIDSLAQDAGLDYTTIGRRLVFWDTHQPIGRLPELRTEDFLTAPTLTQYGMQAATLYAVTDGSGIYGIATRGGVDGVNESHGALEMLASAYGTTPGVSVDPSTLTSSQIAALEATFAAQAERNIAHRWPVPWEVRLSDNTRLSPETNLGINQLVPGVWVPVRARSRIRSIAQWQKLDQVTVTQNSGGESITVVMNPAPNGGQDADSESAGED